MRGFASADQVPWLSGYFNTASGAGQSKGSKLMERLLDIHEAAALLRIKPQTLYLWVSQKRIAYRKVGRLVRFTDGDLEAFVDSKLQRPGDQQDEQL